MKTQRPSSPNNEVKGIDAWAPKPTDTPLFGADRDFITAKGTRPFSLATHESWLRRVHRRVLTWLAFGRFYVE